MRALTDPASKFTARERVRHILRDVLLKLPFEPLEHKLCRAQDTLATCADLLVEKNDLDQ